MAVRALLFDVGGVLVRTDDWSQHRAWEQRLGLPEGGLTTALWRSQMGDRAVVGNGDEPTVWSTFGRSFNLSPADLTQLRTDFYANERVDLELVEFVRNLRPRYKTALLSNAYSNARDVFTTRFRIHNITDEMIISSEVGLAKPDPRIYQLAAERLGVEPSETIFVDDVLANVVAAQQVGMIGVHFRTREPVIEDIVRILSIEY